CIPGARSASPFLSTVVLLHTTAFLDEALSNADLRHRILSSARWAIPSASPASVLVKNSETNVGRVAKAKVLDRPLAGDSQAISVSCSTPVMNILPSFTYSPEVHPPINQEVAYVTPMLAFNLGIHVTCLMVLVCGGQDSLMSWFEVEGNKQEKRDYPPLYVELFPWPNCPKYASHLRISFVKIPECGVLESCRGKPVIEEGDHQDLIDLALNEYFSVDRFLARGDIFYVHVDWHCHSEMCVSCNQKTPKGLSSNIIYFKVMSMEPLDELILRVNCNQTALVLGGSVASAIPPMGLIANYDEFKPIHVETVKTLTSILIPALCPSALLSKFRVAVFLYGSAGCGKRTVVRYVARHLGVHVIEYSCHDFIESSEKKVSAALTNAFKVASRLLEVFYHKIYKVARIHFFYQPPLIFGYLNGLAQQLCILQQVYKTLDEIPLEAESIEKGYTLDASESGLHGLPSSFYAGNNDLISPYTASPKNPRSHKSHHSGEQPSAMYSSSDINGLVSYPVVDA
ncbi:peroxisomal ATPase PEX6-like, partial [Curcuma longa]|uniref:peroxisomal ATPase PEX6-like n=1 Tax=Curcuma longa TaxID=136217 RepID=UPI003D9DFAC0